MYTTHSILKLPIIIFGQKIVKFYKNIKVTPTKNKRNNNNNKIYNQYLLSDCFTITICRRPLGFFVSPHNSVRQNIEIKKAHMGIKHTIIIPKTTNQYKDKPNHILNFFLRVLGLRSGLNG